MGMTDAPPLRFPSIPAMVLENAERYGTKTALIDGEQRWSYAELGEVTRRATAAAIELGIQPGDRVGLWGPNTAEWILSALGILGAGAWLVPLNTRWSGEEIAYTLGKADCSALFAAQGFLDLDQVGSVRAAEPSLRCLERVVTLEGEVPGGRSFGEFLALADGADLAEAEARIAAVRPRGSLGRDVHLGDHGPAQGVILLHGTSLRAFGWMAEMMTIGEDDVNLVIPPFFHCFGYKAGWMASFMQGAAVIPQKVFLPEQVMARIEEHRVSVMLGPPTIYTDVLNHPDRGKYDLSSLRVSCPSAAAVPVELIHRLRDELGFEIVLNAYALTEAHALCTMAPPGSDPELVANFAGPPMAGGEIKIIDDDGVELPTGEAGEVLYRGFNVMPGYYEDPEATAEAIDDEGWLHTGDIGFLNEVGWIKITDRKKDMIITGGFNVYPAEIERVLLLDDCVGEAAVVAAPDARMGEVGVAFIVPRPGKQVDAAELLAHAAVHLAKYKVPREVRVVDSLPKNASMKVLKHQIRDELRAEAQA